MNRIIIVDPEYWKTKYRSLISARELLWKEFEAENFQDDWLNTRVSKHQWSIDEVLRHMIGSETVYIQQPLDNQIKQHPKAVLAQWVGKVFFRLQEEDHINKNELKKAFKDMEEVTTKLLNDLTFEDLNKEVMAPWRQKVKYQYMLAHSIDHELAHMGQVNFILTYYRGPPNFEESWGQTKLDDIEL